jgi:hypothetical protein
VALGKVVERECQQEAARRRALSLTDYRAVVAEEALVAEALARRALSARASSAAAAAQQQQQQQQQPWTCVHGAASRFVSSAIGAKACDRGPRHTCSVPESEKRGGVESPPQEWTVPCLGGGGWRQPPAPCFLSVRPGLALHALSRRRAAAARRREGQRGSAQRTRRVRGAG